MRCKDRQDLSEKAVKIARRIQALPRGGVYRITVVKLDDQWYVAVEGEDKKVEVVQ